MNDQAATCRTCRCLLERCGCNDCGHAVTLGWVHRGTQAHFAVYKNVAHVATPCTAPKEAA